MKDQQFTELLQSFKRCIEKCAELYDQTGRCEKILIEFDAAINMKKTHHSVINCHFDGGCAPHNPGGVMGYAGIIYEDDNTINLTGCQPKDEQNTNNVAEYLAIHLVLDKLIEMGVSKRTIIINGDSNLIIKQIQGEFKVNSIVLRNLCEWAKKKIENLVMVLNNDVTIKWIPREQNKQCDKLVNMAIQEITTKE